MGKICDLQVSGAGTVKVWINTRDHCGPHAHCGDPGSTWEARFRFSYLNNIVSIWDVLWGNPSTRALSTIATDLQPYAADLRREWWRCFSTTIGCCLINQTHHDNAGVPRVIAVAVYDPGTNQTILTFSNGFVRTV